MSGASNEEGNKIKRKNKFGDTLGNVITHSIGIGPTAPVKT